MNDFIKSILVAACLLLNGANLGLQADEHDEKPDRKAHLEEMKSEVANLRAKAAELKEQGRHEAAEKVIHRAKELYQAFQEQSVDGGHRQAARNHTEMDPQKAVRFKLREMEKLMEHHRREGNREEAEELHDHIRELASKLREHSNEQEHEGRVVETRVVIHENRGGEHEEREYRTERRRDERFERREQSPEDHVRIAIENLHAAGWNEAAEHLEREFHERMEQQRRHEDNPMHAHMREMMEGVEHRFREVHEHVRNMERALKETAHRFENLEKRLREMNSKRD